MQLNQVKERFQEANGNRSRAPFQGAHSLICLRSRAASRHSLRSVTLRSGEPLGRSTRYPSMLHTHKGCSSESECRRRNLKRASPPPAPRSRPSDHAPTQKLRGMIGRTARCPPPRPRGQDYPAIPHTQEHPSSLAGILSAPFHSATRQPARSLLYAR